MNERIPDHERLREDLDQILGQAPEPSEELRAAVLEYGARRKRRVPAPRWRIPAAAATMVAAAALVILVTRPQAPEPMFEAGRIAETSAPVADELAMDAPARQVQERDEAPSAAAPMEKGSAGARLMMRAAPVEGDLNGDGRVNIVDAWRLARSIDSGQGQGDLDADGEVSPDDLDRLMQQIVTVRGGAS